MKLLVTGLCISRNLGGPAMALTLVNELKKRLPQADFLFAIDPNSFRQEKQWADYYGFKIVRGDTIVSHMNQKQPVRLAKIVYRFIKKKRPYSTDISNDLKIHQEFMQAYRECDAVINMMGISYVGDGVRGLSEGLISYSNLYYAKKWRKPFTHFIQSFGPFDDWKVRFFARKDFDQVDFVPARGKQSAKYCRDIVKHPEKVFDFPDAAILLEPAGDEWVFPYLDKLQIASKSYTILSPSSVIFNMRSTVCGSIGEEHVKSFYLVAKKLLSEQKTILFLPHMYSENKQECDREICYKVISMLREDCANVNSYKVVKEDIDVWQAKALIAHAENAVVSRYHALVAAISTGVPVITIGWNIKYYDLMSYYGIEKMSIDTRDNNPEQISNKVYKMLNEYKTNNYIKIMKNNHNENVKKVQTAFDILEKWIKSHVR